MGEIYYICVMGISEGDEKEGETEKVLMEIITENPPNLAKDTSLQILEAEQVSNNKSREIHAKIRHNRNFWKLKTKK